VSGQAFVLSGSGLSSAAVATMTAGVSVMAWVRPVSAGVTQTLVSRSTGPGFRGGNDVSHGYALRVGPRGDVSWEVDDPSSMVPEWLTVPVTELFDGGWHHVAAAWSPGSMAVFIDGVEVARQVSRSGSINPAASTAFMIGGEQGTPFGYSGAIDEVMVFNRAITAAEIAGCVPAITRIVSTDGVRLAQPSASAMDISDDGRYVLFSSRDPALDAARTSSSESDNLYVYDRAMNVTELASIDPNGDPVGQVYRGEISGDGRHVSMLANIGGQIGTWSRDLDADQTGFVSTEQNTAIDFDGDVVLAYAVSADGRYRIELDNSQSQGVLVRDTATNIVVRADVSVAGQPANRQSFSYGADLSDDGRYVVFASVATNLVPNYFSGCAPNLCERIYRKDLSTGDIVVIDVEPSGAFSVNEGNGQSPTISSDGMFVGFESSQSTVGVAGRGKAYLRDVAQGVTVALGGTNSRSMVKVSGDGRSVTFTDCYATCQAVVRIRQIG
jgi:hypothetical protein